MKPGLRAAMDIGPLVIFFAVNAKFGILTATAVFMGLAVLGLVVHWVVERRLPLMPVLSAGLVLVFGGMTLFLADETFIKIKPTILYLLFAGVLGVGVLRGRMWIANLFAGALDLPDAAWRTLTLRFIGLFLVQAALNELIRRTQTTDVWVASKFGIFALGAVFAVMQAPFLMRHDRKASSVAQTDTPKD